MSILQNQGIRQGQWLWVTRLSKLPDSIIPGSARSISTGPVWSCWEQFGDKIDWAFNPTTQPDSNWPRNHEWTWQLSRHRMWLDLGRAFYATG
jgi:hypothetical protein